MNDETKLEIITRCLITKDILEAKENKKENITVNLEKLLQRAEQINEMIFDEELMKKVSEMLEG